MEPSQEILPATTELPQPVSGSVSAPQKSETEPKAPSPEARPITAHPPLTTIPQNDSVASVQPAAGLNQSQSTSSGVVRVDDAALIADDADLIEKEWVARAKSIVEQTKADPYVQNRELNKVKAEYIKKRYNKDVKVSED